MSEVLNAHEFENVKAHLRAHRDLATDGGVANLMMSCLKSFASNR